MSAGKHRIIAKPASIDKTTAVARAAAIWGVAGVIAIVLYAIVRLVPYAVEAIDSGMNALQWSLLVVNVLFMAWSEGYRGFQQKFSPRVAARALYLTRNPVHWSWLLLAPLFCIGYFSATRRLKIFSWVGTIGIVVLVFLVHRLDQPWRGIIDAGVVVGLGWGLISLFFAAVQTARSGEFLISPSIPGRYNDG